VVTREFSLGQIKEKNDRQHEKWIAAAAKSKVQILGLQELSTDRTSAPNNSQVVWLTEPVPGGRPWRGCKSWRRSTACPGRPVYEVEMAGVYFNTAAVFDAGTSSTTRQHTAAVLK